MSEIIDYREVLSENIAKHVALDEVAIFPVVNQKGKIDGLTGGKLVEGKKNGLAIKARSTIKFIFQILIGLLFYTMVLGSLMILKINVTPSAHILMIFILFCAVSVGISIALYIFYPLIAPRVFDLHHGFFYTKPLSSYIHIIIWDSERINITPLEKIDAIQIIRIEKNDGKNSYTVDQTNIILQNGSRIALMIRKNALTSQIQEDAHKLSNRIGVPVLDGGTVIL